MPRQRPHVPLSLAMRSRYSHVRMEARRRALGEIAACQRATDEKRKEEAEQQQVLATFLKQKESIKTGK